MYIVNRQTLRFSVYYNHKEQGNPISTPPVVSPTTNTKPKPRTIHEEVYTLDKDGVDALALLGLNVADFITARYERGGYHVVSVERITPKRVVNLDLHQLWESAGQNLQEAPATPDSEVAPK